MLKTMIDLGFSCRVIRGGVIAATMIVGLVWSGTQVARADPFLDEIVEFTGEILYFEHKVPALVIGVVRNDEISIHGFGERAGAGSRAPDRDTLLRIGSITKAFTGQVLAHLVAENRVRLGLPSLSPSRGPTWPLTRKPMWGISA